MEKKPNFKRFKEIVQHDFTKEVIKKNVGDEARTFNIIDQSKPLLSPSRLSKVWNEHIFWNIPNKNLLRPRLMGSLIHKFIELRVMTGEIVKLNNDNLEDYAGGDYATIITEWKKEQIDLFIEEVNIAVSKIYDYLKLKDIVIMQCEKYVCDNDYHGYIDMVAYKEYKSKTIIENGANLGVKTPMIIDLKVTTGNEIKPEYYLQLSIYRHLFQKTASCYILFYNRDTQQARLEKASWNIMDFVFNCCDLFNRIFRYGYLKKKFDMIEHKE